MLLQLMANLSRLKPTVDTGNAQQESLAENRNHLYGLLCQVQQEIERAEQLFSFAEDEALIDNTIYLLKSLRAQQQFLVQNIRKLDGIGADGKAVQNTVTPGVDTAVDGITEKTAEDSVTVKTTAKEGFVMG